MENPQPHSPLQKPGLLAALMAVAKNLLGLILNRTELAALEFSEVRANFLKFSLIFSLGIIAIWFAVAYWTVLLVFLTWESLGWKILLIMAALFSFFALGLFVYGRAMIDQGKLSMTATMAELRKDRDALL